MIRAGLLTKGAPCLLAFFLAASAEAKPITSTVLIGTWELRTVCMSDRGTSASCIAMKPGSLELRFLADGRGISAAKDEARTLKAGRYEMSESQLVLRNVDGSLYQRWQPDLSDDEQSFQVVTEKLSETFVRTGPVGADKEKQR